VAGGEVALVTAVLFCGGVVVAAEDVVAGGADEAWEDDAGADEDGAEEAGGEELGAEEDGGAALELDGVDPPPPEDTAAQAAAAAVRTSAAWAPQAVMTQLVAALWIAALLASIHWQAISV